MTYRFKISHVIQNEYVSLAIFIPSTSIWDVVVRPGEGNHLSGQDHVPDMPCWLTEQEIDFTADFINALEGPVLSGDESTGW